MVQEDAHLTRAFIAMKERQSYMCSCVAHQSLQSSSEIVSIDSLKKLIRAPRRSAGK